MKSRLLLAAALFATRISLAAQEPEAIPPAELAKATAVIMEAHARLGELPLKPDLDPSQAVGFKIDKVGAIFVPDRRLKADKKTDRSSKSGKGAAIPAGELWTLKLAPLDKGVPLPNDKLRLVAVGENDRQMEVAVFVLAVERAGKKGFQLAIYGKESSPVMRVPLAAAKSRRFSSATMVARKTGDESGVLELSLLGRYKAEIPIGKQAE